MMTSSKGIIQDFLEALAHRIRRRFSASIKHILQTDLRKDKISCVNDFISVHVLTLALKIRLKL